MESPGKVNNKHVGARLNFSEGQPFILRRDGLIHSQFRRPEAIPGARDDTTLDNALQFRDISRPLSSSTPNRVYAVIRDKPSARARCAANR